MSDPKDCPEEAFFRREVAARLGNDPFTSSSETARSLIVDVDSKSPRRVTITILEPGRPAGKRVIVAPPDSCSELVANAALAASVAIDSAARSTKPEVQLLARAEPPQEPVLASPPPAKEQPTPTPPSIPLDVSVRAGAGVSNAVLPSSAFGVAFGGALRSRSLSVGLDGRFDLPTSRDVGSTTQAAALHASLITGELSGCRHFGPRGFEPYLCAAAWVGALRGASTGIAATKEDVSPYVAAGPRLGALIPLVDHVAVDVRIDAPFTLTPIEMRIDDRSQWRSPIVGVVAGAGVVLSRL